MLNSNGLQKVRNIGIMAHIDAGKTTVTERILYYTGRVHKMGEVHEGTATMDWMPQERERGITISSAVTTSFWKGYQINTIDTPGHVDFTVEVERSLRILDGAIVVFCAVGGVEPQTETVWHQADRYQVPRIAFINKMDRTGADFYGTIKMIKEKFSAIPLVTQIPWGKEGDFQGIIDIVQMKAYSYTIDSLGTNYCVEEIPEKYMKEAEKAQKKLFDILSEEDESFMEDYLYNKDISEERIYQTIRKLTIRNKLVPVLCGSALKNKGIQLLLDAVNNYLPSPLEVLPIIGEDPKTGKEITRKTDVNEPLSALVFKVTTDPFFGRLCFIRVYSGTISEGHYVYNSTQNIKERINRLVKIHADHKEQVKEISAGNLGAIIGLKKSGTGDTLCDEKKPIILEKIKFPEPVISIAIEPKSLGDREKMAIALNKIGEEDPTFKHAYNKDTGQTIISGMGELHLEIIVDRLLREYKLDGNIGEPQVAFRETVTEKATARGRFIRQSGGKGQYGDVIIEVEPYKEGTFEFIDRTVGGSIPKEYMPAVKQGIQEAMLCGVMASYPVTNIRVSVIDGSFHSVDSSELAFKIAASIALKEGLKKANPVLLEPIVEIEIRTPEEYLGSIISDLNSRRAKILGIQEKSNIKGKIIIAHVPLQEVFGYATNLRSITQGRAIYVMQFAYYEIAPEDVIKKISCII
ncbi:MAG: elongation factor G [Atribacterota bacterium]|nr:elongation factor G [Atribacterota bacterium]